MPQTKHKVPFSGKAKKQQLKEKKQRQHKTEPPPKSKCYLLTTEKDEGEEEESNVLSVNQQPSNRWGKRNPNRFNLQFHRETEAKLRERMDQGWKTVEPVPEECLEINLEDYFPPDLSFPTRPHWDFSLTRDQLNAKENKYFTEYLKNIEEKYKMSDLSYFELNLETWRQLWRVLEMADVVLLITDIRFPALMFPPSLYTYVTDYLEKQFIVVLNKIDLAPSPLVLAWKHYLRSKYPGIHIVMFTSFPSYNLRNPEKKSKGLQVKRQRGRMRMAAEGAQKLLDACKDVVQGLGDELLNEDVTTCNQGWCPRSPGDDEREQEVRPESARLRPELLRPLNVGTLREFDVFKDDWALYQEQMDMFFLANAIEDKRKVLKGPHMDLGSPEYTLEAIQKCHYMDLGHFQTVDLSSWQQKISEEMLVENDINEELEVGETVNLKVQDTSFYKYNRFLNGVLTIGCIGQPNVGKSSLMNALMGKKVVSVSKTPGHTKHFQTIFLTKNVKLCDCPGLVFPSKVPKPLQILMGSFPIAQLREPYSCVQYLAERVDLVTLLKIEHPDQDDEWSAMDICDGWAKKKGFYTAKAARLDSYRGANHILRMALEGKIPLCMFPPGFSSSKEKWSTHPDIQVVEWIQAAYKSQPHSKEQSISEDDSDDDGSDHKHGIEGASNVQSSSDSDTLISASEEEEQVEVVQSHNKFDALDLVE